MLSSFLEDQLKQVKFTILSGEENSWDGQNGFSALTRECIVSTPTTTPNPTVESGGQTTIRVFCDSEFTSVKQGDLAEINGVVFSVTDVNNSGSLPGPFPFRANLRRNQ